jgi:hypothetical protein
MAFTPSNQLQSDSNIWLKDWRHASRLFVNDQFRLAPKQKFLFAVQFGINLGAVKTIDLIQKYGPEIGMLVKSIDLPSYTVSTEMLNQYNRKKVVQYQYKPGDSTIKFHDDSMGLINQLWQNYYSYYYADSTSAGTAGAYSRNATRSSDFITTPYGFDNGSTEPFFKYIVIWQYSRHEFVSYRLHNPIISSWNHNKVDYEGAKSHDFDMKISYEAVTYGSGVTDGPDSNPINEVGGQVDPQHYDMTPSPLQPGVGGFNSALAGIDNSLASFQQSGGNLIARLDALKAVIAQNKVASDNTQAQSPGIFNLSNIGNAANQLNNLGVSIPSIANSAASTVSTIASKINLGL